MKRILLENLKAWKSQASRKPLVLDGARQVGKTHLIEFEFGEAEFAKVHKIDFRENRNAESLFADSLDPEVVLRGLELELNDSIDLSSDLIFFDEIGECQLAVDALKYFCERRPDIYLCASGSNIGLLDSFPVGKTYNLELFPMSFYEFLLAGENSLLIEEFEKQSRLLKTHEKLWQCLLDYYFVGGMPEAVRAWYSTDDLAANVADVEKIHGDLLIGYERDFGKYGGRVNALHIASVFKEVPLRLQATLDDSVKRFTFKNIISGKKQYSQLRGSIDWLERSKLVSKNYIIRSKPRVPRRGQCKDSFFKLFFFDVGLLCHALGVSYREILKQDFFEKGFIAENFVQNELRVLGEYPTFSWQEARSEMEFILKSGSGELFPVEVKSGRRTKARSLRAYIEKYKPELSVKLIGNRGGVDQQQIVWPLYYAYYLNQI